MKRRQVHQKYFTACHICNYLLSVSSGDETLRLMLGILLQQPKWPLLEGVNKMGAL